MEEEHYEEESKGTQKISFVILVILFLCGLFLLKGCPKTPKENVELGSEESTGAESMGTIVPDAGVEESSREALETLGVGVNTKDPVTLMKGLAKVLDAGDLVAFSALVGEEGMTEDQAKILAKLIKGSRFSLQKENVVQEVGELEINRRSRWALKMEEEGRRLFFDLVRESDGTWKVERMILPKGLVKEDTGGSGVGIENDALGIADAFLQAVLRQDFEHAKFFLTADGVSDAKLAGLCIIFEEGEYRMREKRPLRGLFNRGEVAGFLANVEDRSGEKAAQFGITLQRDSNEQPWRVQEVNLDQLLADYASRVAGGDVHYTPLLKNPNGGDTIVLYFDFDKEELESRSERQLKIVTGLLKLDPNKKIRIAGHTDGFGSVDYNRELSAKRARSVKEFLIRSGVPKAQVVTEALGQTQPRRPNTTKGGEDNPSGRRVNRRTEIYLDF